MTEQDQDTKIAALEQRLKVFEDYFTFIPNPHTGSIGCMTQGRLGVLTQFWMNQPDGQGAAFSIGTAHDRFGAYVELDAVTCPDHPSTAIYASCVAPNTTGQNNIAIEAHVANAPINITLVADGDGVLLGAGVVRFLIGRIGGVLKQLWP